MAKQRKIRFHVIIFLGLAFAFTATAALVFSLYLDRNIIVEGTEFVEDTEEIQHHVINYCLYGNHDSLNTAVEMSNMMNLAFEIKYSDGTAFWKEENDKILFFNGAYFTKEIFESEELFRESVNIYSSSYNSGNNYPAEYSGYFDNSYCYVNQQGYHYDYVCARHLIISEDLQEKDGWVMYTKNVDLMKLYGKPFLKKSGLFLAIIALCTITILITGHRNLLFRRKEEIKRKTMIDSLAHDLKNPVAAIDAYSRLLGEELNKEKTDEYLAKIRNNSIKLNSILEKMLHVSSIIDRSEDIHKEKLNLSDISKESLERFEFEPEISKVRINDESTNDAFIIADKILIIEAMENLISNALKNCSDKGEIIISFSESEWTVFNSGKQIKRENIEKIWDSWFMEDNSRGKASGSGLGLYIVRTILDAHGFGYKAENTADGVRFSVIFK